MPTLDPIDEYEATTRLSPAAQTHILIAEDDAISAMMLKKTLMRVGYKNLHLVSSGADAVAFLKQHQTDIYISDIGMPGEMDGIEAGRIIEKEHGVPIIFITGFSDSETIRRAKDVQPAAYLLKPYKTEEVTIAIEMALHKARIQRELQETEHRNRMLVAALESTQDAILIIDTLSNGPHVEYVNDAFCRLLSKQEEDCLGTPLSGLLGTQLARQWIRNIRGVIARQIPEEWECKLHTQEGENRLLRVSASLIHHEGNSVDNLVLVIRDITALRLAEERQRHSQKIEAIGRFTGGIAHDFNNLLAVINSYSDLIKLKMGEDSPFSHYIDNIRSAGQRGTDLVAQLMTFTRSQPASPRLINLCDLTESTFVMLRRLIRENIELRTEYAENVPLIKASPSQIEQILVNLCVNARDAIEREGSICISIKGVQEKDSSGATQRRACICVEDNGCGMAPDTMSKVFEPFFTTKDVGQGTGLGLSTVYGIVKQNGGTIEVESELGKGTCFTVYFPADDVKDTATSEPRDDMPSGEDFRGSGTILVLEDDETIAESITGILSLHGYTLHQSGDAEEALEKYLPQAKKVDMLVTDLLLPTRSGQEVAAAFHRQNPNIKILYITGYTDEPPPEGCDGETISLLHKPFRMSKLLQTCKTMMLRKLK